MHLEALASTLETGVDQTCCWSWLPAVSVVAGGWLAHARRPYTALQLGLAVVDAGRG